MIKVIDLLGNNAVIECPACGMGYLLSSFVEAQHGARKCPHCESDNGILFKQAKAAFGIGDPLGSEKQATRQTFDKQWLGMDVWVKFTDPETHTTYRYPHDQHLQALIRQCGIIEGSESWEVAGRYNIPRVSSKQRALLARYAVEDQGDQE